MKFTSVLKQIVSERLLFLVALVVIVLTLFWDPLFSGLFLWGPDSGSTAFTAMREAGWLGFVGRWEGDVGLGQGSIAPQFIPHFPFIFVCPPGLIQACLYVASVVGAVLAGVYLLRGKGISGWPSYLGALALGFSPHTFSLISAGHMGKLQAWPFVILLLAAVDRAVTRRSLFHYALAGYSAGVAMSVQADMAMLFVYLSLAYGLFLVICTRPCREMLPDGDRTSELDIKRTRRQYVTRNALGSLIAGVMVCCVAVGPALLIVRTSLPQRQALAQAVGGQSETKGNQWEFATNWSLPTEELAEFLAAGIFGWQTGDPNLPYWGKTGRTLGWETHRRGLISLRQNAHYLGLLTWVFALYAVSRLFWRRGNHGWAGKDFSAERRSSAGGSSETTRLADDEKRTETVFWAVALVVSILLALGRNAFLYRIFYMLPYGSSMRAPVKFLHLAEISICILFAIGLNRLFKEMAMLRSSGDSAGDGLARTKAVIRKPVARAADEASGRVLRAWTRATVGCGVLGLAMLLVAALIPTLRAGLMENWSMQGIAQDADRLLEGMVWALVRAGGLLLGVAAVFMCLRFGRRMSFTGWVGPAMMLLMALDLISVNRHYIRVWDEYTRYTPASLISRLKEDGAAYRVALPVGGGIYDLWRTRLFPRNKVVVMDASNINVQSPDQVAFRDRLLHHPWRLWQLTSTRDIIGPTSSLSPLTNLPAFTTVAYFNVLSDGSVQWTKAGAGRDVWMRLGNALQRAALYTAWTVADEGTWQDRIASPQWDPEKSVIVVGDVLPSVMSEAPVLPVDTVRYDPNRVEIKTQSTAPGVLLLNDAFDVNWSVRVDGKNANLLRCNGVMRGVHLAAGEHTVVFSYCPSILFFVLSLLALGVVVIWGSIRLGFGLACRKD